MRAVLEDAQVLRTGGVETGQSAIAFLIGNAQQRRPCMSSLNAISVGQHWFWVHADHKMHNCLQLTVSP